MDRQTTTRDSRGIGARSRSKSPDHQRRHHHHREGMRDDGRRSRSPREGGREDHGRERKRHRDEEQEHSRHHSRDHHQHSRKRRRARDDKDREHAAPDPSSLPFDARRLSKRSDFATFRPLFAYYLDLQKGTSLWDIDEREARGRWKSFVGKWNRGELMEGWYDPEMFLTAKEREEEMGPLPELGAGAHGDENYDVDEDEANWNKRIEKRPRDGGAGSGESGQNDDNDDDMGPALPPTARNSTSTSHHQRSGPGIPTLDDLAALNETRAEDDSALRESHTSGLRSARAQDRKEQKERLEELAPRADPGTRERRMEKRAVVNEKMKGFRDGSPGADAAVGDGELMGGGEGDGIEAMKKKRDETQRRKTEREIRREEFERAKAEEREQRLRAWREREEGTMEALKELARQRFG